jgi:hypothetical protein
VAGNFGKLVEVCHGGKIQVFGASVKRILRL